MKNKIIEEIDSMGIVINGRRFFRGFHPTREEVMGQDTNCYRINSYPKVRPYSWTIGAKKGEKFNWKTTLWWKILNKSNFKYKNINFNLAKMHKILNNNKYENNKSYQPSKISRAKSRAVFCIAYHDIIIASQHFCIRIWFV